MREIESRFRTGVDTDLAQQIVEELGMFVRQFHIPSDPAQYMRLVAQWEKSLNMGKKYPPHIYLDAISSWLAEATHKTFPPYPGDILEHCRKVMDRIGDDPIEGPKMKKWWEDRRMARIEWMVGEDNE